MSTGSSPSPFQYTVDLTKVFLVAIAAVASLGLVYLVTSNQPKPQVAQPSVPSLIPPPLSCLCGTSKATTRPFNVTCPYCRNAISVQPSATGSIGQAIGEATAVKVAK